MEGRQSPLDRCEGRDVKAGVKLQGMAEKIDLGLVTGTVWYINLCRDLGHEADGNVWCSRAGVYLDHSADGIAVRMDLACTMDDDAQRQMLRSQLR